MSITNLKYIIHSIDVCVPDSCLEFGLPSVLGIAFGGFLIGVLLIGALWFIKIRTGNVPRLISS